MRQSITLNLDRETYEELQTLSDSLGFSREMTAIYAIRLVNACVREGLLEDVPARAWPKEAQLLTGTGAKVIDFPADAAKNK